MLEKLKFWRREEFQPLQGPAPDQPSRLDPLQSQEPGSDAASDPFAQLHTPNYPQPFLGGQQPAHPTEPRDRDTELILAKLDAIKSDLDAISQRLRTVEQSVAQRGAGQQRYW